MYTQHVLKWLSIIFVLFAQISWVTAASNLPPVVSMNNAIGTTLKHNPEILLEAQEVEISGGQLTTATGEFDWNLSAIFANEIERAPGLPPLFPGGPSLVPESSENTLSYSAGVSRKLRNGIIINPNTNVTIFEDKNSPSDTSISRGELNFELIVPLARGAGVESAAAFEASSMKDHEASQALYEHEIAFQIFTTITAFWNCIASKETLKILSQSEARAIELEQTVNKLSNANLFSPAYIDQAKSNSSSKKTQRINEQLNLYKARQTLGVAMGLQAMELINPPLAEGHFPDIKTPRNIHEDKYSDYIDLALENRKDYLALQKSRDASYILREAARLDLRPRVDLNLNFGYQGIDSGKRPYTQFVKENNGMSIFGSITLDLPFENNVFKGRLQENTALTEQATILQLQASQIIASDVMVALTEVENSHMALLNSLEGEDAARSAVDKEYQRFTFGDASLLDVIKLEDDYILTQLNTIQAILNHMVAIARFRFTTGKLMTEQDSQLSVQINEITEIPLLN